MSILQNKKNSEVFFAHGMLEIWIDWCFCLSK